MGSCKFSMFSFLLLIMITSAIVATEEKASILKDGTSLLSFKSGIVADPKHALDSWNLPKNHVCNWTGVTCNKEEDQVVKLNLTALDLRGIISPAIANLSWLTILNLSSNFFEGHIPPEIGSLAQLKRLILSKNQLKGNIPSELGFLQRLQYLDLSSNWLMGHIPPEIGSLVQLERLSLSSNLLDGNIPSELGFLKRLQNLNLRGNQLVGQIPVSLLCNGSSSSLQYVDLSNNSLSGEIPLKNECQLKELRFLQLWSNRLVGPVPPVLANSTKLLCLDLSLNMLSGELPSDVISKMSLLQYLYLSYNHFVSHDGNTNLKPFFASLVNSSQLQELELAGINLGGEIPSMIGNLSAHLVQLNLDQNLIYGSIPPHISNLFNLTLLNLSSNLLNGTIPPELCRMSKLERVFFSNNFLSGEIPSALGDNTILGLLDLSENGLSGSIPDSFANLSQLRRLLLCGNQLSGTIPPSLGKCTNLEILDLSHNNLSGVIPAQLVAGLKNLQIYLNLSSNRLSGPLPLELSKMAMVLEIDLSSNNLSGDIPPQLGSCIALEYLNLSGNLLGGRLPASIGQLRLRELDVCSNRLIGEIPETLQASSTLQKLNFSFNMFSGYVSNKGAFSSLTIDSFLGNSGLCGSIKGMSACKKKHAFHFVTLALLLLLFAAIFVCYRLVPRSRFRKQLVTCNRGRLENIEKERKDFKYPRISYQQLIEATGDFNPSNLIGSGRFGHVYEGTLRDNTKIAVKVLDLKTAGEFSRSFKRECLVLKRTRHRNLMKIITICSRPDFKALVLPLMSNGSLERHLYPSHGNSHRLDLVQLVNIFSDVAEGVAYLHHYSPVKVVHCDLKPSNILLDDDMTALVTDFGIARLLKGIDESVSMNDLMSFSSSDGLLCGSVGYIAPEYGMGRRASTQGDVYSFGVLVLEILTRRRPTDVLSHEGSSLHEWVKSHYPHKLEPIVEQAMVWFRPPAMPACYDKIWRDIILELIELGLMCTQYTPPTRPSMLDVAQEMARLKQYLANPSPLLPEEAN